jgi:hypothetical protein
MSFVLPVASTPQTITWDQIVALANRLTVDPNVLNAVYLTESSGNGYLPSGRVKILFEGHVFWRNLVKFKLDPKLYVKGNEDILYKVWTKKFYKGGEGEYTRLYRAMDLHESSGLCAASYGAFQVLGENYEDLGYPDPKTFVLKMCEGGESQLEVFGQFLKFKGIIKYMKQKNWDRIAYLYNGSGYKTNRYDVIMNQNYTRSVRQHG